MIMKKLSVALLLLISFQGYSQDYIEEVEPNITWLTDIDEAKALSENTKKPIVMYFTGSDWCGPCKLLKKDFFSSDKFEKMAEGLVLLKVDIPRRIDIISKEQYEKNTALVHKFNKQNGYPNLVAINPKGDVLGSLSGYTFLRETDRHFAFIESVIENY
jgi:thioredoxin-related protein